MKPFKPMLASPFDEALLKFPVLASPKLDGVRAIVRDGVVLSRALKPIPNKWVQQRFSHLEHFDGELIVGASNHPDVLRTTTSGVMRVEGEPDVSFHVFDHVENHARLYTVRYDLLEEDTEINVFVVPQHEVANFFELNAFERDILAQGWEGVMLRRFDAPYKFGRSTAREGYLLKVKRFHDDSHGDLPAHLGDLLAALTFARRPRTRASHGSRPGGEPRPALTPHEYTCKISTAEPDRLILDPITQMPELNS